MITMAYYFFSLIIFFVTLCSPSCAQIPAFRAHSCVLSNNYTANSLFPTNLNTTLSSLYKNSNTHGFYNASSSNGSESAHSLFLCRGDISPQLCQTCIKSSTESLLARCPRHKEAIIWYDECMLRYSNRSIVSVREERPKWYLWNPNSNEDPVKFEANVVDHMSSLVNEAVSTRNFYATGDVNGITDSERLYGLVQCTPDISQNDCNSCLIGCVGDIPRCCHGKRGGRVLNPSCSIRFESDPFYESTAAPSPPPAPAELPSPPPQFVSTNSTEHKQMLSKANVGVIVVSTVAFVAIVSTLCYCFISRNWKENYNAVGNSDGNVISSTTVQSLQMDLDDIKVATNDFSDANKIGQGGFGSVYKGAFANGQEIAVKRLSTDSSQGSEEFKNEVLLLARLEHRNLARLIGFCLQGGEKLLVYEFVPNKSLDYFLFDPDKQALLNWSCRYKIIGGIARGLLYLHEDSRLRIIHRDLKPSNVLLDKNMIPKISDFGMAKIFGVDQSQGNTRRIAGTYGYMSPKYGIHGRFSVKSDVYSFGILVLEILSGKKMCSFDQEAGYSDNLPSFAWRHWRDGTALELIDPSVGDSYSRSEVITCIHVGLLSVQENPTDRPTMDTVVLMLSSSSVTLSSPHQPAFFIHGKESITHQIHFRRSQIEEISSSVNKLSITELDPR